MEQASLPPITDRRQDVVRMLDFPVNILIAKTGSGKSTYAIAILLEELLRRGDEKTQIVVTQPKRLLAVSIATYVATIVNSPLGELVGYHTGESHLYSPQSRVVYSTDGVALIKELHDKEDRPKILVIDEVHEWNINQATLTAWMKNTLPELRKRNTKLIMMSATIDLQSLMEFFPGANVVEVEGRSFPVTDITSQRPPTPAGENGAEEAIALDCLDFVREGQDTLVFLDGVAGIMAMKKRVEDLLSKNKLKAVVLPLHSGLDAAEQDRVFAPTKDPKVVLATNIAQSGVTVPGITRVVVSGYKWETFYLNGVEGLKRVLLSLSEVLQCFGRAGRTQAGEAVWRGPVPLERLKKFPTPEIQRSSPDRIVLDLASVGKRADRMKFIHPPNYEALKASFESLKDIGALNKFGGITGLGLKLVRFPCSADLGVVLLEAEQRGILPLAILAVACMGTTGGGVTVNPRNLVGQGRGKFPTLDKAKQNLHRRMKEFSKEDGEVLMNVRIYLAFKEDPESVRGLASISNMRQVDAAIAKLSDRLGIEPATKVVEEEAEALLKCLFVAFKRHTHKREGQKLLSVEGKVVRKSNLIGVVSSEEQDTFAGKPFQIAGQAAVDLLTHVTPVNPFWAEELFPDDCWTDSSGLLRWNGMIL